MLIAYLFTKTAKNKSSEQTIHGKLALRNVGVLVGHDAEGGDERDDWRLARAGLVGEPGTAVAEPLPVVLVDDETVGGEFHFAEVDDAVGAVYEQVYLVVVLFVTASPGGCLCQYAAYLESLLDLLQVGETHCLKGVSLPTADDWRLKQVGPEVLVVVVAAFNELKVEQRVEVGQAVDDIIQP